MAYLSKSVLAFIFVSMLNWGLDSLRDGLATGIDIHISFSGVFMLTNELDDEPQFVLMFDMLCDRPMYKWWWWWWWLLFVLLFISSLVVAEIVEVAVDVVELEWWSITFKWLSLTFRLPCSCCCILLIREASNELLFSVNEARSFGVDLYEFLRFKQQYTYIK